MPETTTIGAINRTLAKANAVYSKAGATSTRTVNNAAELTAAINASAFAVTTDPELTTLSVGVPNGLFVPPALNVVSSGVKGAKIGPGGANSSHCCQLDWETSGGSSRNDGATKAASA